MNPTCHLEKAVQRDGIRKLVTLPLRDLCAKQGPDFLLWLYQWHPLFHIWCWDWYSPKQPPCKAHFIKQQWIWLTVQHGPYGLQGVRTHFSVSTWEEREALSYWKSLPRLNLSTHLGFPLFSRASFSEKGEGPLQGPCFTTTNFLIIPIVWDKDKFHWQSFISLIW